MFYLKGLTLHSYRHVMTSPEPTRTMLTSAEILAYWTPERIRSAVPADDVSYEKQSVVKPGEEQAVPGPLVPTRVPQTSLTTFPYQCVGRLYFTIQGIRTWTSAYHIGNDELYTVAHAVVVKGSTPGSKDYASNLAFIPAMIDYNDHLGQNYGFFPQIPGGPGTAYFPDPNFDPANMQAQYDKCIVKLGVGSKGKTIGQVLPPIQLLKNQQYNKQTDWNTIGYPDANTSPEGFMFEVNGTFVPNSLIHNSMQKYGAAPKGMSGGPWILSGSGDKSNGIQAGNTTSTTAISTYFQ